jgi:HlyD family secretion protein
MVEAKESVEETLGLGRQKRPLLARVGIGAALVAFAAGLVYWAAFSGRSDGVRYLTAEAGRGSFAVIVTATGTVEPTNLVEISSELSGTLASVNVDYNDTVEVGTVLASLDTTRLEAELSVRKASLDAAIARVAIAQATLDEARERYQTALSLEERGVTTRQAFVSDRAAFIRAQAELQSAEADRALAEANLDLQQAELDKSCICSPIRGVVLDRAVDAGQIVAASLSAPVLFTVAEDLTEMELHVDIDEADIGRVAVGDTAEFTVDAYDDSRFPAEIVQIRFAPETTDGVVTYKAILTIDNSRLLLRPGMTATADITVAEIAEALIVPNAALRYVPPRDPGEERADDERSGLLGMLIPDAPEEAKAADAGTLWVLEAGVPREVTVRAGDSDGKVTEITGGELAEGDLVITGRIDG